MAYTPTEWKKGDVVTSEKLNNLEAGVASGGVLVVNATIDAQEQTITLDKTAGEIFGAAMVVARADLTPFGATGESFSPLNTAFYNELDGYTFGFTIITSETAFSAATADDYPTASMT